MQSKDDRPIDKQELWDFAPLPMVLLDRAGMIRNLNLAAATQLHVAQRAAVGLPLAAFVEAQTSFAKHLVQCRSGNSRVVTELVLKSRDGHRTVVELTTAPLGPDHFSMAIVDVSQRRAAEDERDRLVAEGRSADQASRAKDTFIASLSHELRTPVTAVLAAASALGAGGTPPRQVAKLCAVIERNVEAQARLIDDLLDVTRIVHGKVSLDRKPMDLHAIARAVAQGFSATLRARRLRLVMDLTASHAIVDGDEGRLGQVVSNLLGNAVKFTPTGGQIALRSWNNARTVALEVSDTGPGLSSEAVERIFQPFEQVDTTSNQGLGLGLAIARGIMELHQGRITAGSAAQGAGARFVIELETTGDAVKVSAPVPSVQPVAQRRGPQRRILLVEDHRDTAEALSLLLAARGFRVETASSVASALRAHDSTIDLVISDLGLPGGGGLTLMRKLRQRGDVKAIALSGYGTEKDVRASRKAGFITHLTKPVSLTTLLVAMKQVLPVS